MTDTTNQTNTAGNSRPTRRTAGARRTSTPERIITAGLATAACVGIVGVLGTRMVNAQETAAQQPAPAAGDSQPVLLSGGAASLNPADVQAYATALAQEKARLDAYRADLVAAAAQLNAAAAGKAANNAGIDATTVARKPGKANNPGKATNPGAGAIVAAPAPVPPKPVAVAPPAPRPAPQAKTYGS